MPPRTTPTMRAARAFLTSPRSDLRPAAYGRAEALGLRARGLQPQPLEWHPSHPVPRPAPLLQPSGATVSHFAEHQAVRDLRQPDERARDHAAADSLAPLVDLAVARLTGRPTA